MQRLTCTSSCICTTCALCNSALVGGRLSADAEVFFEDFPSIVAQKQVSLLLDPKDEQF